MAIREALRRFVPQDPQDLAMRKYNNVHQFPGYRREDQWNV